MSRISLSEVWDQSRAFIAKELSLLAPVALTCFAVPLLVLSMVMPPPPPLGEPMQPKPWMFLLIPVLLVEALGWLTLMAMVLTPAISVGEAMRRALARLPVALGVMVILTGVGLVLLALMGMITGFVAVLAHLSQDGMMAFALFLIILVMLIAMSRLAVIWPSVIDNHEGPFNSLKRALRLTRGDSGRLFGVMLLATGVSLVLSATAQLAGGSVLMLLGGLFDSDALGRTLTMLLNAIVLALWQMVALVYVAFLYRAFKAGKSA